ncbi:MAG: hypothetical protein ABIR30_13785 [Chitinophagaceae bacterium]
MGECSVNNHPLNRSAASLLILLFILFIAACSHPGPAKKGKRQEQPAPATAPVIYIKPPASSNDTLIITGNAAVFYTPDPVQKEKIKGISNPNNFETEEHNCYYQIRNARAEIKKYWPEIRIIETFANRYLLFVKADNTTTCIDLNSQGDMCGLFLFDRKKDPILADMMNIDTALGFYFE